MPLPSLVFWLIVIFIGLPSMLKNWTAVALVGSWLIGAAWLELTGEGIPLEGDILRDYMVLVVIFLKVGGNCQPSPGALGLFRDCWAQSSRSDKTVICLFAPMWLTYAVNMDPFFAYEVRWSVGVLQFLAVGAEVIEQWRRGRALAKAHDPTDLTMSRLGWAGNEW